MKRKLSIVNYPLSIALLLGLVACESEVFEEVRPATPSVGEGRFVVDYSGELKTRAIHEDVEKGARINSLTYLLYQDPGGENSGMANATLLKRREIPDLGGHGEDDTENWPLTRENMTWDQREALKDTLDAGYTYYAVFVANADALLWGGADAESPLKDADLPTTAEGAAPKYSDAYLQLSSEKPFDDYNMFYLDTKTINGTTATREEPLDCPITLRRIVTRTDWWFERLPELWTESDETGNSTFTEDAIAYINSNGLNMILANALVGENPAIANSIVDATEIFLGLLKGYFEGLVEDQDQNPEGQNPTTPGTGTATPGETEETTDPEGTEDVEESEETEESVGSEKQIKQEVPGQEESQYASYRDAVGELITLINGTEKQAFIEALLSVSLDPEQEEVESAFWGFVNEEALTLLKTNDALKAQWKKSVAKGQYAEMVYAGTGNSEETNGEGMNQYYLLPGKGVAHDANVTFPRIEADATTSELGDLNEYVGFNWVGFANPEQNTVEEIKWYANAATTDVSFTLTPQVKTGQGTNEWYQIAYRPVASLSLKEGWTASPLSYEFDLATALPFDEVTEVTAENMEAFKEAINEALQNAALTSYGTTLGAITLSFDIPDFRSALTVTESWSAPQKVEQ